MRCFQYLFFLCYFTNYRIVANVADGREGLLKFFIEPIIESSSKISMHCHNECRIYKEALLNAETWAVQMYDATEKIPFGIVSGNFMHLGNYDQCLDAKSDNGITGKACVATMELKFPDSSQHNTCSYLNPLVEAAISKFKGKKNYVLRPFKWLWCVPSSCEPEDIHHTLDSVFEDFNDGNSITIDITLDNNYCSTLKTPLPSFDVGDWCYVLILFNLTLAVIVSTIYDLRTMKQPGVNSSNSKYVLATSFSLYTNWRSLLSTKSSDDDLKSLYAIRFLSICMVIYIHTVSIIFVNTPWNLGTSSIAQNRWTNLIVQVVHISVDTFLLLAGIVLVYTEVGRQRSNPGKYRLNVPKLYISRYVRIAPSYMMILGLHVTIFRIFGSGPLWNEYSVQKRNSLRANWWYHPLFIVNYLPEFNVLVQTWYLAVDMQLHWIAPIFLYPLLFKGTKHICTIALFCGGIAISVLSTFFITFFYGLPDLPNEFGLPEVVTDPKEQDFRQYYIYCPLYAKMDIFLLGAILGYFLRQWKKNPPKMKLWWITSGWLLAVLASMVVVFSPTCLSHDDEGYDAIKAAFYIGFQRILIASVVGWIVFATEFGYGGPVGSCLMWSVWIPLGKLTFSIYLTHISVMTYNVDTLRRPPSIYTWDLIMTFVAYTVLTMIPAIILCLCVEMPFGKLGRLLIKHSNGSNVRNRTNGQTNQVASETIDEEKRKK